MAFKWSTQVSTRDDKVFASHMGPDGRWAWVYFGDLNIQVTYIALQKLTRGLPGVSQLWIIACPSWEGRE